ncbi:MAG: NUDIX hydrolase [Oscillospiraceae bacterium]|nr:NUDIX hydrolase [Oscillospiraceae bacterium]
MEYVEKQLSSEEKYSGLIIKVKLDEIELYNGKRSRREVVEHSGGVCVVPLGRDGCVTAVRQYRYPVSKSLIELPAGKLEKGEDPYSAALRELEEETGLQAEKLVPLGSVYSSPGFSNEELFIYLAENCSQGEAHPDADEFLDVIRIPLDEFVRRVMADEIRDGKTCVGILKTYHYVSERKGKNGNE